MAGAKNVCSLYTTRSSGLYFLFQDFDPEDIDISVEGSSLLLTGRREVKHGNSSSVRQINQKFVLPPGVDVSRLATEVTAEGGLIISAPQIEDGAVTLGELGLAQQGEVDMTGSSEAKKTVSEAAFEVEGGQGTTRKVEDTKKKAQASTTKRVTDDGWEEEVMEESSQEVTMSSSSTSMSSGGGGRIQIPAMGGTQTTEVSSSKTGVKAKDGKILEMQKTSDQRTETKEMVIPIQIQGRPAVKQKAKTPKPRMLPFEFPALPGLSMDMSPFEMAMPSADDMMKQMQADMEKQMSSMMGGMQMQMGGMMGIKGSSTLAEKELKSAPAEPAKAEEEMQDQDIFVPLRHINRVQKNALSEATAMAKMRDGIFELVVNIQGFEPEDVQIFSNKQTVFVKAKSATHEGLVKNAFEQKFSLPDDVDTDKLSSGMSKDGILMIRVPRRTSPEKIIPIKKELRMEVVKKALNMTETSVEQLHAELEQANIVPLNVEKPEDAVAAASAEVVESLTVGVAEMSGAEAGEVAGQMAGAQVGWFGGYFDI